MRQELPERIANILDKTGARTPPKELNETIQTLCNWKALTVQEIAFLLKRQVEHLQKRNIKKLMSEGKLAYLYPQQPTHPQQKYVPGDSFDKA
ncbi:MAG: hypothetical protein QM811_21930 [Pirellulales bacterium]